MEKTRVSGGYKYCDDLHLGKHQSIDSNTGTFCKQGQRLLQNAIQSRLMNSYKYYGT